MKTKVTKQIIQKCVLELYYNTFYSRKLSISSIANKLSLSKCLAYLKEQGYSVRSIRLSLKTK